MKNKKIKNLKINYNKNNHKKMMNIWIILFKKMIHYLELLSNLVLMKQ